MNQFRVLQLSFLVLLTGCGRYFGGPIHPVPESSQEVHMVVGDDGSVTYVFERLEIGLRPMTDEELNRQFPAHSTGGAKATNPFTYGDWKPLGERFTPPKYTVFLLSVKNYAYPKVLVDPARLTLVSSTSRRTYKTLTFAELVEYYYAQAQAYTGNNYKDYQERRDLLRRNLYAADVVFSGHDLAGYVLFPKLAHDVTEFSVHIDDVAVRFNYRNEPTETIDLTFRYQREVHRGYQPPPELTAQR